VSSTAKNLTGNIWSREEFMSITVVDRNYGGGLASTESWFGDGTATRAKQSGMAVTW